MEVSATLITGRGLARQACSFTTGGKDASNVSFPVLYRAEHSPIRCVTFFVEMIDIPSFVSVHLCRHKHGVEHFVESRRDDRGGTGKEDRYSPVRHAMFINAQALIFMSRRRLCTKAHLATTEVWLRVRDAIRLHDPDLATAMVRECDYRGACPEAQPCGWAFRNLTQQDR